MGKRAENFVNESSSTLKAKMRKAPNATYRTRLLALYLIQTKPDLTRQEVATHCAIHIRTLERWVHQYLDGGLNKLLSTAPKSGRKPTIPKHIHNGLSKKLQDTKKPLLGYWEAVEWVSKKYNKEYKYHTLRNYMIKHFGSKLKIPRKSHVNKDAEAEIAFLKMA